MSFNIKPLADRVVVKAAPAEEVSKGGIILPDTAQEKPQMGTVIAVGPGKASDTGTVIKLTVKKGDKITGFAVGKITTNNVAAISLLAVAIIITLLIIFIVVKRVKKK